MFALVYDNPGFTLDDLRRMVEDARARMNERPTFVGTHDGMLSVGWEDPSFVVRFRWSADDDVRSAVIRGLARQQEAVDPAKSASHVLLGTTTGPLLAPGHVDFVMDITEMLMEHPALTACLGGPDDLGGVTLASKACPHTALFGARYSPSDLWLQRGGVQCRLPLLGSSGRAIGVDLG